jgi:protoporphyrinogen oxidase
MDNSQGSGNPRKFIIIGAGPAGLTAAYELTEHGHQPLVLEKSNTVGGIARTENYKGFYFDMGGHRFFTKSVEVNRMWEKVLGDDFLLRPRLSRIYYNQKFFSYPLEPMNALKGLGIWQGILVGMSYLRWQLFPYKEERTFEEWVTNRFGGRLFKIFFKSYTEKVWGISTSELTADFATQRIKDLDLKTAILSMFFKPKKTIQTLIDKFHYPRRGPGMMWAKFKEEVENRNGKVLFNNPVVAIRWANQRVLGVEVERDGSREFIPGTDFISSMAIADLIKRLDPPAPAEVLNAAHQLKYRDFLTVGLVIDKPFLFADNWIYVHDPSVHVGRIQNFKNWSREMVADESQTTVGMEYFCNEGDDLWCASDDELIELGRKELSKIGLANYDDIKDGVVYRVEKTYPVYDSDYSDYLLTIRRFIDSLENLQTIGRNGLHRYNNQDHSMLTGMYAVRNALFEAGYDLWKVNAEQAYHETIQPEVELPAKEVDSVFVSAFTKAFQKLDPRAFGVAWGIVSGFALFFVTLILAKNQWNEIGLKFYLLSQFLPGYAITTTGSLLGLIYGFIVGYLFGWLFAFLKNFGVLVTVAIILRQAQWRLIKRLV